MNPTHEQIENAKQVLRNAGYYVDNLWQIADVKHSYNCTDQEAMDVLDQSLTNEGTMEQINFSIREFAELDGLEKLPE